jgi:hypothetical protein
MRKHIVLALQNEISKSYIHLNGDIIQSWTSSLLNTRHL